MNNYVRQLRNAFSQVLLAALLVSSASAGTLYVKLTATGAGTGASWDDAYTTIQAAVAAATAGDEVRVAQGVYRFTAEQQVLLNKQLSLYGGFKGDDVAETIAGRDFDTYQTIITGEPLTTTNYWKHAVPDFDGYAETVTTTDKPLLLDGKANIPLEFDTDYDYYLFDGTDNGGKKVIEVASGVSATIDGFWFVGCYGNGNTMSVVHFTSAGAGSVARNLRFLGCFNTTHNTGMLSVFGGSSLLVEGCKFYYTRNTGGHGAAFYQLSNAVLVDCEFFGVSHAICGSIIENRGGTLNATNLVSVRCVSVTANANASYGAQCLLLSSAASTAVVIDNLVMTNCGSLVTGVSSTTAIPLLRRNGNYTIKNSYFGNNRMQFPIRGNKTYALFMAGDDTYESTIAAGQFVNVTFERNVIKARAGNNTGGVAAIGIVGGPHSPQTLVNCTFIENEAVGFDDGMLVCHASSGVVNTSLASPTKNGLGVANSTFIGDTTTPAILLVNPKYDGYVNIVNCILRNSANEAGQTSIRIVNNMTTTPVNLIKTSINDVSVVPAGVAVLDLDTDPILLMPETKTLSYGSLPLLRPASRSGSVTNGADVAALSYGFAYRADESSPWTRLNAAETTALTVYAPLGDALDTPRNYGAFMRGAVQGLTAAAETGHTVVVRKLPRSGGTVTPIVQAVPAAGALADITATPATELDNLFVGWYGDAATQELISSDNPLTAAAYTVVDDAVIYAKFGTPIFNITFNLGNFATFDDTGLNTKTITLSGGQPLTVPPYTMEPGYLYEGFVAPLPEYVPYANVTYTLNAVSTASRVIYVTPDGTGDGSSWENATSDIQAAINDAGRYRGELWLKAGTYKPTTAGYYLRSNVELVGGFAGTESSRSEADPSVNRTIISGDLGNPTYWQAINGTYNGWSNLSPQQYVWVDGAFNFSDAMLDSFGWLNPFNVQSTDAEVGFYLSHCTNTAFSGITFTLFRYHVVLDTTGNNGLLKIDNCEFLAPITSNNEAHMALGLTKSGTWLELSNTKFEACRAAASIATGMTTVTNMVKNCSFKGCFGTQNSATCLHLSGSGTSLLVEESLFKRCGAYNGTIAVRYDNRDNLSVAKLRNCRFEENVAYGNASGLISLAGNGATVLAPDGAHRVEQCRFIGNRYESLTHDTESAFSAVLAHRHGKAIHFDGCYFADNVVSVTGGFGTKKAMIGAVMAAQSSYDLCGTLFVNCTFENNAVTTFTPATGSPAIAGIFVLDKLGCLGLVHSVIDHSVLPTGIPEIAVNKQSEAYQVYAINSIIRNETLGYLPWKAELTTITSYTPGFMNTAVSALNPAALGWSATSYAVITNLTNVPGELSRTLTKSADDHIWSRGIVSASPYARQGRLVVRHSNGLYYAYVPELDPASPWRRVDSGGSAPLAAASIDLESAAPLADALGLPRIAGRIAYGPLNTKPSGAIILLR